LREVIGHDGLLVHKISQLLKFTPQRLNLSRILGLIPTVNDGCHLLLMAGEYGNNGKAKN